MKITSLHVSHHLVRVLSLSLEENGLTVDGNQTIAISDPISPPNPNQLDLAQYLTHTHGTAIIALGSGQFHMQRVPLEVASEADRKAQINWEASQALIDPIDHYTITFEPAGRVAFWTAIRKEITQTFTDFFSDLEFDNVHFLSEPMALHGLCKQAKTNSNQGAIWLGHNWGSFVAQNNQALTTAETVHLQHLPNNQSRILSQIKQWIQGDLSSERRRPTFENILLCGESDAITALSEPLSAIKMPHMTPIDISNIIQNTTNHDLTQDFALALGAALTYTH